MYLVLFYFLVLLYFIFFECTFDKCVVGIDVVYNVEALKVFAYAGIFDKGVQNEKKKKKKIIEYEMRFILNTLSNLDLLHYNTINN